MTRKDAVKVERDLRARGVYKPHVSQSGDTFMFESWPLEARVKGVFDAGSGPMMNVTVVDSSLNFKPVATVNLTFGQDTVSNVAPLLIGLHAEAYARAKAQEKDDARRKVASSHGGKFTYWQDADRYIYQRNEITGEWIGWYCSLASWESMMGKSEWLTLEVAA